VDPSVADQIQFRYTSADENAQAKMSKSTEAKLLRGVMRSNSINAG